MHHYLKIWKNIFVFIFTFQDHFKVKNHSLKFYFKLTILFFKLGNFLILILVKINYCLLFETYIWILLIFRIMDQYLNLKSTNYKNNDHIFWKFGCFIILFIIIIHLFFDHGQPTNSFKKIRLLSNRLIKKTNIHLNNHFHKKSFLNWGSF